MVLQGRLYDLKFDALGRLYVGGNFNSVKANTRNYAASLTTNGSGTLRSWNPNANSTVKTLLSSGNTIYIGGSFTTMNGGTTRNYLASVDTTNGNLKTFNPHMNSTVERYIKRH